MAPHAAQRALGVVVGALLARHQPVQLDRGVDLLLLLEVVVQRVDLEDLDQQRGHVLGIDLDRDQLVRGVLGPPGRGESNLHPLLELLVVRGVVQHRVPALHVPHSGQDLRLREEPREVLVPHEVGVGFERIQLDEKVSEVGAHQRLIATDRCQVGRALPAEVDQLLLAGAALQPVGVDVPRFAREPQVLAEAALVRSAELPVVPEPVVQDVCLERVVSRGESPGEGVQPVEVGLPRRIVAAPLHVGARLQAPQIGEYEVELVQQLRPQAHTLLQLLEQERVVEAVRTEPLAPLVLEVANHQGRQVRKVGALQPGEQLPQLLIAQLTAGHPLERRVPETAQRLAVQLERPTGKTGEGDEIGVEPGGQVRLLPGRLPLLLEGELQALAQEAIGARGILPEAQERLAILDLLHRRAAAVPLPPELQQRRHGIEVPFVLGLQAVVVVVVRGPRDQLLERRGTVVGEGEVLLETDLGALGMSRAGEEQRGEEDDRSREAEGGVLHGTWRGCDCRRAGRPSFNAAGPVRIIGTGVDLHDPSALPPLPADQGRRSRTARSRVDRFSSREGAGAGIGSPFANQRKESAGGGGSSSIRTS